MIGGGTDEVESERRRQEQLQRVIEEGPSLAVLKRHMHVRSGSHQGETGAALSHALKARPLRKEEYEEIERIRQQLVQAVGRKGTELHTDRRKSEILEKYHGSLAEIDFQSLYDHDFGRERLRWQSRGGRREDEAADEHELSKRLLDARKLDVELRHTRRGRSTG
jgi:hypothetical protein